jgi:hypothetical protein
LGQGHDGLFRIGSVKAGYLANGVNQFSLAAVFDGSNQFAAFLSWHSKSDLDELVMIESIPQFFHYVFRQSFFTNDDDRLDMMRLASKEALLL